MFVAGGAATGVVAWSGNPIALPVALVFPALWAFAPSRLVAALVALAYFLAASRGLPVGASIFFGMQYLVGIGLWVGASSVFVAAHVMLWTGQEGWKRPARYAIAAILMSIPPLGIAGWAHPVTAAGILFPGWGWFGLAATTLGMLAMATRKWPIAAVILAGFYAWSITWWVPPKPPDGWAGIDTGFRFSEQGSVSGFEQHMQTIAMVKVAVAKGARVVVLPESALGLWTFTSESLWRRELAGLDVVVNAGAAVVNREGYDNVMMQVSGAGTEVLYRERMPVPVSMWQPWAEGGVQAHFFENPAVTFAGSRIAPLICYEQLIVWPILQSMLYSPDVLVATGNGWWTGGGNIVEIQKASTQAWASLFGLPLVMAFNK